MTFCIVRMKYLMIQSFTPWLWAPVRETKRHLPTSNLCCRRDALYFICIVLNMLPGYTAWKNHYFLAQGSLMGDIRIVYEDYMSLYNSLLIKLDLMAFPFSIQLKYIPHFPNFYLWAPILIFNNIHAYSSMPSLNVINLSKQ